MTEQTETKSKQSNKGKKTTRKSYKQLNKQDVLEILESMSNKTTKTIANKFGTSESQVSTLFKLFNTTNWRPKKEDDTTPKGFMFPKNIPQIVKSIMYDKGFVDNDEK